MQIPHASGLLYTGLLSGPCTGFIYVVGIGRETAIALARAGWTVVLFARRASQLKETQAACPDPDAVMVVEGDVTKEEDIVRLFNTTIERYGASN